eukprot:5128104-Alexandrium_andersonii.AAC.1
MGGRHQGGWPRRGLHHQLQDDLGHVFPRQGHWQTSPRPDSPLHRQGPRSRGQLPWCAGLP